MSTRRRHPEAERDLVVAHRRFRRRILCIRRPSDACRVSLVWFAAIQVVIWAGVYGVYLAVRGSRSGRASEALANAWDVIGLERAIGIFDEVVFRALDWARVFFSGYYILEFGPLVGIVLVWFGLRDRGAYRGLRNALLLSIALATVVYAFFPTAPPRLVDGLGIEDSVGLSAHDTGSFLGIRFNPYAAVPSMHVGGHYSSKPVWLRAARFRPLRTFFVIHPLLMAAAVTATGNHFFLDSLAGLAVWSHPGASTCCRALAPAGCTPTRWLAPCSPVCGRVFAQPPSKPKGKPHEAKRRRSAQTAGQPAIMNATRAALRPRRKRPDANEPATPRGFVHLAGTAGCSIQRPCGAGSRMETLRLVASTSCRPSMDPSRASKRSVASRKRRDVLNRAGALLGAHDKLVTAFRLGARGTTPATAHVGGDADPGFDFPRCREASLRELGAPR